MEASELAAFPDSPKGLTLTNWVLPVRRSWTNTLEVPFAARLEKFVASEEKATNRPSALIATGPKLSPLPCAEGGNSDEMLTLSRAVGAADPASAAATSSTRPAVTTRIPWG